jgi:hypothetical protein
MERLCEDAAGAAPGQARLALQRLRLNALPAAVRLAALASAVLVVFPLLRAALLGPAPHAFGDALHLLLLTALPAFVLPAWWHQRRHARLIARPDYEPALNERAIVSLAGPDFARVQLAGEIARETVWLPGWRPRWLLVTNRRLLLFTGGARERRLVSEWPRRSIVFAGAPVQLLPGLRAAPWLQALTRAPNLALVFTTGTVLQLHCASAATALRVAQLLMASPALPDETMVVPVFRAECVPRRWHEVLASAVVPGAGQCLQGRFTAAGVFFGLMLLLFVQQWAPLLRAVRMGPDEWTGLGLAWAATASLLLAAVAGSDAWHYSATRLRG